MTETSVLLTTKDLVGATQATAFVEQSPTAPYEEDRLVVVNPLAGRVIMVARDETRGSPAIADLSPVISPAPTRAVVNDEFLFTLAEWSVSLNGELRKYISAAMSTPLLTIEDEDAGGPLLVTEQLFHGRTRNGASLVARDIDDLAVLGTVQLPATPTLLVEGDDVIYVFCAGSRFVQVATWDATRQQFDLDQPLRIPQATRAVSAAFDGVRLVIQTPDVLVLYNTEDDTTELVHRDNNAGLSSVDTVGDPTLALTDGSTDEEYQTALWRARFNPGKDRQIRDYYMSAEQLAKVGVTVGTTQAPADPVTNRATQPLVRRVGQRWMVLDGVTGRLAMSGDLVWRFRGMNVAEQPRGVPYAEPDAAAEVKVSRETAVRSRMAWEDGVGWTDAGDDDHRRYAYLDGDTAATFGSVKTIYLPNEATLAFWIKLPERDEDTVDTLLHQTFTEDDVRTLAVSGGVSASQIHYDGLDIAAGTDLYDGDWHHIVLVLDESGAAFYVDGVLVDTDAGGSPWTPADPVTIGAPVYLGRVEGDDPDYYMGWLGDCRIYKLAATPQFVADLFDRGPTGLGGGSATILDFALLLESGDSLLLESGDLLLLEEP